MSATPRLATKAWHGRYNARRTPCAFIRFNHQGLKTKRWIFRLMASSYLTDFYCVTKLAGATQTSSSIQATEKQPVDPRAKRASGGHTGDSNGNKVEKKRIPLPD